MTLIAVVWKGNNCSFSTVDSRAWRDCYFHLCSFNWTWNICHKTIVWCGSKGFSRSKSPKADTGKKIRQLQPKYWYLHTSTRSLWLSMLLITVSIAELRIINMAIYCEAILKYIYLYSVENIYIYCFWTIYIFLYNILYYIYFIYI
jgi:hypothetical protein